MRAVDLILKKRDGGELSRKEISFLISGYVDGSLPEYQISAWLMSVFFRGMTARETADLTQLMLGSGSVMDLSGLTGPFVDKHSTGGVGDKVSLILAPMAAACGIRVPMMSGRALGHTGGTLDKLESIPGYRTGLSQEEFRAFLTADGFAMTGQTAEIVPADKKLYALRDVTATVESVPLITASILSKKVAEGAEALVFDVKCGPGAFMKDFPDARRLAEAGLTRYHHNLETARTHFPAICTTHEYDQDIETILLAKEHGLEVCSGGILGLGESWEQRIELAATLRELGVDTVPLNFLNPIPGTPLGDMELLTPHDALKSVALFRLMLPGADITVAGGREKVLGDYQSWLPLAGANGMMIGNYLTTMGRDLAADLRMLEQGAWI